MPANLKENVLDGSVKTANHIKFKPLRARIFKIIYKEMGSEHTSLLLHTDGGNVFIQREGACPGFRKSHRNFYILCGASISSLILLIKLYTAAEPGILCRHFHFHNY
jgi:hypothetical protein